jgi:hypothetical protein
MAISSASTRVFKAEDPVLDVDLQLLAKVNTYQQDKFDQGEKSLQDEVNNWSMLANVAKPQDKQYINQKLNSLVSGIKNLGGVNLADPNNVNTLKSLGYNMYGDDNVMNPVITTRKMNQLSQDIAAKTNGKNAKDYDSVYGEYLQNQYSDWLNDGKQGTSFSGPISLPQGSFDGYTKKITDAVSKLKPDMNEAPQDSKDAALNYYQVGDKFIKKERVEAAIDALTSSQDRDVLSAHAWKSTRGLADSDLIHLQSSDYDSKIKDMQDNINTLQYQKSLTGDFKQKQLFSSQIDQLNGAIKDTNSKKQGLLQQGPNLDKDSRQQLSENLFYNSFKNQYSAATAYDQKKVELKTNQAAIFNQKSAQENYWHGKDYDLKVLENKNTLDLKKEEVDLKKRELDIKEESLFTRLYGASSGAYGSLGGGPAQNAPLSLVPVKGKDDAIKLDNSTIVQADANYTAASKNFYEQGYDYLMSKDPTIYGNYLSQDADGHWVPKDERSANIVNKGLQSFNQLYGNIANMSIKEREGLKFDDDSKELFRKSKDLEEAGLYKSQIKDITADVFRKAGKEDPDTKNINISFGKGSKFGDHVTLSYSKLKEMIDKKDPLLDEWRKNADVDIPSFPSGSMTPGFNTPTKYNGVSSAVNTVSDYYDDSSIKKAWDEVSKTVNPYARVVSLPKQKNGKLPDQPAKILSDAITDAGIKGDVNIDDIDLNKVWTVYDPQTLQAKYMAQIRYKKAQKGKDTKVDKGDKYTTVDLTKDVNEQYENGGGWISNLYSHDNASVVYGLALQNQGKTPFDPKTNYEGALQTHGQGLLTHKYQIVSVQDPKTKGTAGYKVFVAIPLGKDDSGSPKFQTVPVPNFLSDASGATTTFPANFEGVRSYMESAFKDNNSVKDFYTRLGIPFNQ